MLPGKESEYITQLSVHRLPRKTIAGRRVLRGQVEPIPQNGQSTENGLVALKLLLLSPAGDSAWSVMHKLQPGAKRR